MTAEISQPHKFGWPHPKRIEYLQSATPTGATHRIVFQGDNVDLPILRVPIGLPKYRLENGRTASIQLEYLAKHPNLEPDFFTGDTERSDVQEVQHSLLKTMISQSGLKEKFSNAAVSQVEPIILDYNGYVINGNRRLCTWRSLLEENPASWKRYEHIDVVVLPFADYQAIDKLEASLQIEKDVRADYTWESKAIMMRNRRDAHGFSEPDLALLYNLKLAEIRRTFDMLHAAEEYLKSRGNENMWSLVANKDYAFQKFVDSRRTITDIAKRELFTRTSYAVLDNASDTGNRLYETIPSVQKYLGDIEKSLAEVALIEESDPIDDPFGDGQPVDDTLRLAVWVGKSENSEAVRTIVNEVIENRQAEEKDQQSALFLLKQVRKANTALNAAVSTGLTAYSDRRGVSEQLIEIEALAAKIRIWLDA